MARIFALFLLLLVSTPALAQHHHKPHEFKDVEKWIKRFEEPSRKHWQKPQWLITKLGLEAGQAVADIGAAGGYFSFPFADQVGPSGRVLAVEVEPGYFPHLRQKASELGITWLETVKADIRRSQSFRRKRRYDIHLQHLSPHRKEEGLQPEN